MTKTGRMDLFYWAMILAACSMGEAVADFLSHGPMNLGYALATLILMVLVVTTLYLERSAKVPNVKRYWTTVIAMSTAGTTLADYFSRTLKMGYFWSTAMLFVAFFLTLMFWKRGTLRSDSLLPHVDIHAAKSTSGLPHVSLENATNALPKTDNRYWAAIMVASTLGTTLGDALSNGTKLGFGGGTLLLSGLLTAVLILEYRAKLSNEFRYWSALILASTIGATSGDYVTKAEGLDLGYYKGIGGIILVFLIVAGIGKKVYGGNQLKTSSV